VAAAVNSACASVTKAFTSLLTALRFDSSKVNSLKLSN
jgi:hypothetical protein